MTSSERVNALLRYLEVLLKVPSETTWTLKEVRATILAINKELGLEII